jgi:uncharacterized protein (TIGR02679 family)
VTLEQDAIDRYREPGYRRLLEAARRSLERSGGRLNVNVGVPDPSDAERRTLSGITGRYRPAGTKRIEVSLVVLDDRVRAGTGLGLRELLEAIGGELVDRPARAAAAAAARDAAIRSAESSPLYGSAPWYRSWLAGVTSGGLLTKLINQGEAGRLRQAVQVLEFLENRPADAKPIMIPALAAGVTHDTKALNGGTLGNLVLWALATRLGVARPKTAEERRDLWDRFDVIVDDLASRVLVLNLPCEGEGLGEWLSGAARYGTPFQITLHQLLTHPIRPALPTVFVCENPAVLRRAAGDLGRGCAPLICTEGIPSAAFHRLAQAIVSDGGVLRYHGDFDWPGIAIANQVMARHGARPWRMGAADYLSGVAEEPDQVALTGKAEPTRWEPELASAMEKAGRAVYEETVADPLIVDLRCRVSES